jgi:hypothetical protein
MKGYLAYSGMQGSHSTTSALSRARTRSMLTLISRPVPSGEPPPATPKRQRKPKSSNTDVVECGWTPSLYRAAA